MAFLFTDIEASTRRWEGDRAAMAADLASHDTVMNQAVVVHHGRLFTHTGDGLGAVFPTAADAIGAAVAGQRVLAGVMWRGRAALRVRMAIHVGDAEARAGTFFGPTLNRTARLLDHARGGEILCSQAAADLAGDDLPADVTLANLGLRRLKGLSRPERIWRVLDPHASVPAEPKAPLLHQMPASLSTFVGREAELSELAAVLAETRLLTITGLGGAGKTRLALELAGRMGRHYGDGARIVELVSVRDERLVGNRVLSVIGADPRSSTGAAAEEQLCQALAERQMLLVLDNCEHLLQAAAALAAAVLRGCPDVTIVATSREVLSLPGEVAWAAPGLSLPPPDAATSEDLERSDAVRLFCVRARAAHPGFEVTGDNALAVAAICRRLDGIPLALELAAARVKVLGVTGVAGRLEDRLRLLVGGPRSAPSRHQTLRAAMDWSFELLPEAEQGLLRRLSVFPQSFDLDAATAISGHPGTPLDVVDLLGRLIDTSLLVAEDPSGTTRYRLLETVREYAGAKLAVAGEEAETQTRHWRHFADRVRSAHRSGADLFGLEWARHVASEAENYNAALAAALTGGDADSMTVLLAGLDYPWLFGTPVPSVVDSIEPAMLRCDDVSLRVEALFSLALAGLRTGRWTSNAAVTIYEQALQLADRAGTPHDRGVARFYLGYMARSAGDTPAARAWMEEALRSFGHQSKAVACFAHYELGWIDMIDGDSAAALDHFRRGLALAEQWPGFHATEVHLRAALGLAEVIEGHSREGLALAGQAVDEARILGLPAVLIMALVRAAEAAVVAGQSSEADLIELFQLLRHQGSRAWVAAALTVAALTHAAHGRHARAAQLLGGAAAVARVLGEDPEPIPAIAALVAATRRRLTETLGAEALGKHEAAGRNSSLAELLRGAIDS